MRTPLVLIVAGWFGLAQGVEVAGVRLLDRTGVGAGGPELVPNGAGLRTRFLIKVYAAARYLEKKRPTTAAVLALKGPKRVSMHLLPVQDDLEKELLGQPG